MRNWHFYGNWTFQTCEGLFSSLWFSDTSRVTLFRLERWCFLVIVIPQWNCCDDKLCPYRSGLGLSDQISSHHGRLDCSLLDSGGLLETVRVDTTEKLFRQIHTIESFDGFVPVGIEIGIGKLSTGGSSFFFRRSIK